MTQKWTSTAGPIQTKRADKAMRALSWEGATFTEVNGVHDGRTAAEVAADPAARAAFRVSTMTSPFSATRPEVAPLAQAIGERFGWTITRENVKAVEAAFNEARATLVQTRPIRDKREQADVRAAKNAEAAGREAERAAKADAAKATWAAVMAKRPAHAAALITAEWHQDASDHMTDYHSSPVRATFAVGWRTGSREDFGQLRAAGAAFLASDQAAAQDGEAERAAVLARITEHRDNYSMGAGNYLSTYGWQGGGTGWTIQSTTSTTDYHALLDALPAVAAGAPQGASEAAGATLAPGTRPGYVEVRFPAKPDPDTLAELKGAGFRWALRSRCWYGLADRLPATYAQAVAS